MCVARASGSPEPMAFVIMGGVLAALLTYASCSPDSEETQSTLQREQVP